MPAVIKESNVSQPNTESTKPKRKIDPAKNKLVVARKYRQADVSKKEEEVRESASPSKERSYTLWMNVPIVIGKQVLTLMGIRNGIEIVFQKGGVIKLSPGEKMYRNETRRLDFEIANQDSVKMTITDM